jgi:PAS domain S-box-containing protein
MQERTATPSPLKQQSISLQEMKNFFMQAPAAIAVFNGPEFRYTLVNPIYEVLFDRLESELIGRTLKEVWPDLQGKGIFELFDRVYKTGEPFSANEFPATFLGNSTGETNYYNFILYPVQNSSGNVTDLMVHAYDVTQQVLARKKIEESEERFRTLATEFPLFVWVTDEKLKTTFLNRTGLEYFNIDAKADIADLSWKKFIHPDDLERILAIMNEAAEKHESYSLKMRLRNGDTGEYRWFLDNGMPQFANGKFAGFIGTSMDIHEQKLADEIVRQSEENYKHLSTSLEQQVQQRTTELLHTQNFLQQVIDTSVELISVLDKDLRYITINKKFEEVRNLEREYVKGKHLLDITPKAEGSVQHESMLRALRGESIYLDKRESVAISNYFVDTYFIPLMIKGKAEGVIIMSRDVTEIVKSEQILENKNKELNEAQQIAQLGNWEWNTATNEVSWSEQMYHIYGYEEKIPMNFEKAIERMLPEDAEKVGGRSKRNIAEAKKMFNEKGWKEFHNPPFEYRIILPDATKKNLKGAGKIILNDEGNVSRIIGTVQDITEHKRAEEQIRVINKRLSEAQEIAQLGSWEWDVKTNELTWSENLYNIYEVNPRDGVNYEKFISIIHPEDKNDVENYIGSFFNEKRFDDFYHRIITPAGVVKILHSRGEVILDEEGNVVKMIGTGQDVTAEKMVKDKLIETNEKLAQRNQFVEKLLNSSLDLITVVDKELRFIAVNKKAESVISAYYPVELIGKKINEVNPALQETEFYSDLLKAFEGEIIIRDKVKASNSENYYEHNYVPLMDASGEVYAVMTISHDITESISQMEALRKLNESDKLKSDFIKMASHELKTPVTSIKGYVQLVLAALKDEENKEKALSPSLIKLSLVSIDKQITRLTRLMSELLDLSKIETGKLELNKEVFNLNELVIETVQDVLYTNPKHRINISHDFGCTVFGDKDRIGQVLINLLTNGIKYSPDSDKVDILIQQQGKDNVSVSVRDYGIGIDKKYHDKIFDRFYRVEGKLEQTYPGFGIGLFIAKEIIQQHEGSVYFSSEKGKGSVFTFTLAVTG